MEQSDASVKTILCKVFAGLLISPLEAYQEVLNTDHANLLHFFDQSQVVIRQEQRARVRGLYLLLTEDTFLEEQIEGYTFYESVPPIHQIIDVFDESFEHIH